MEGHCLCGAIKVRVEDENLFGDNRRGHLCHCANCRKVAGSLCGHNFTIPTTAVHITGEENLSMYSDPATQSGTPVSRYFCKTCGCPIKSMTPVFEGMTVLKLGIFQTTPVPEWESFAERRQGWERPVEGCVQYRTKSKGERMEEGEGTVFTNLG